MKQEVEIVGMTCEGCANTVKTRLSQLDGSPEIEVNVDQAQVSIDGDREYSIEELKELLVNTPYSVKSE